MGGRGANSNNNGNGNDNSHTFIDNKGTRYTYVPAKNTKGEKGFVVTISGGEFAESKFYKTNATLEQIRRRALNMGMITKAQELEMKNRRR